MTDDDFLYVDDLVHGKVAEHLGEGIIPTGAILLVETISDDGPGFRYVISRDLNPRLSLGMLRAALIKFENDDLNSWEDGD